MGCRRVEFATTESKVVTMELTWGLHEQRDVVWDYFLVLVADVLGDCKLFQYLKDHHTSIDLCQFQWIVLVILAVWVTIKQSPPPCRRDDFDCYLQNGLCTFWREQALELGSKLAHGNSRCFGGCKPLPKCQTIQNVQELLGSLDFPLIAQERIAHSTCLKYFALVG